MARGDPTQSSRSSWPGWMAAGTGLGVSLMAPLAGVAAPAWAGAPGSVPLPGGLAPRPAGAMDCTSDLDEDDDDDLADALRRAEPGDLVCVPLDDETDERDEDEDETDDQAGEQIRDRDEERPAGHLTSPRHHARPGRHDRDGERDRRRRELHSGGNSGDTSSGKFRPRAMTSGERQYRIGCLQGYISKDCERFSVESLLRLGINPHS